MADNTLNRTELVAAVAAESGQSQAAVNGVLDALFSTLSSNVANGVKVTIPGWIAVEQTARAARTGRNPQTGEPIEIKASKGVKISAGSKLKAAVK
jgi:DNA-binding protein HU-beta